jgi:hypothetical protein
LMDGWRTQSVEVVGPWCRVGIGNVKVLPRDREVTRGAERGRIMR